MQVQPQRVVGASMIGMPAGRRSRACVRACVSLSLPAWQLFPVSRRRCYSPLLAQRRPCERQVDEAWRRVWASEEERWRVETSMMAEWN